MGSGGYSRERQMGAWTMSASRGGDGGSWIQEELWGRDRFYLQVSLVFTMNTLCLQFPLFCHRGGRNLNPSRRTVCLPTVFSIRDAVFTTS